eukprot:3134123-Prymnesium_polylepis.1
MPVLGTWTTHAATADHSRRARCTALSAQQAAVGTASQRRSCEPRAGGPSGRTGRANGARTSIEIVLGSLASALQAHE